MSPVPASVRRSAARASGALAAALVLALLAVAPAGASTPHAVTSACSVHPWDKASVQKAAAGADAVIAARITAAVKTPGPPAANLRTTYWRYIIRVVATFRGSAQRGATAPMTQVPPKRRAGTPLAKRSTYLLFLHQHGVGFTSDRCGGSVLLKHGLSTSLRSKLTADLSTPAGSGVVVQWRQPDGGVRNVPSLNRLISPGVGLSLIGILGLLLIGRLARERS